MMSWLRNNYTEKEIRDPASIQSKSEVKMSATDSHSQVIIIIIIIIIIENRL